MKQTLLDMTQSILSNLSSDEVNSISDTTESLQVAEIIKQTYYNIISRVDIPNHTQLIQLDPSLDASIPVLMYIPQGVANISNLKYYNSNPNGSTSGTSGHDINTDITPVPEWTATSTTSNSIALGTKTFTINSSSLDIEIGDEATAISGANSMTGLVTSYVGLVLQINVLSITGSGTFSTWTINSTNTIPGPPGYEYVTVLPIAQFINMINMYNTQDNNVESYTFSDNSNGFNGDYTFLFRNDKQPQFCTVLSNYYVLFDSYDDTQDSTLQSSKSMALGEVIPSFTMTDSFIPNLTDEQFPLLLNEAKSLAFYELKNQLHQKAEQEAKRGWSKAQKSKNVIERPTSFEALPNFGRRNPYYYGTNRTFYEHN